MPNRKVLLYIAMSLDGYIAKPDDNLDFLSMVDEPGEDYGYSDFINTVDTVILGRKTYDKVMSMGYEFPHTDKDTYILTRSERPSIGTIKFFTADLRKLILELKQKPGKHIFVDGGAETVNLLLMSGLIDEFYVSILPILLGDGIQLFKKGRLEQVLELVDSKHFNKGLVQLHYIKAESGPL